MRAFVVEDDPDFRDTLAGVLEGDGWSVRVAEDGIAALGCIHREIPDLIILDLSMPNLDGMQVLHLLRSTEAGRRIPVIVVTGMAVDHDTASLASAVLAKPAHPDEFKRVVRRLTSASPVEDCTW